MSRISPFRLIGILGVCALLSACGNTAAPTAAAKTITVADAFNSSGLITLPPFKRSILNSNDFGGTGILP